MKASKPKGLGIESFIVNAGACSPAKDPSRKALQIVSAIFLLLLGTYKFELGLRETLVFPGSISDCILVRKNYRGRMPALWRRTPA